MAKKKIMYRYVGDGSWIPGYPARDLTADDLKDKDTWPLDKSPLYEPVKASKAKKPAED